MTQPPVIAAAPVQSRAARVAAWLAVGVAVTLFIAAAMRPATSKAHDLLAIRNASSVWLHGEDPYDPAARARGWQSTTLPAYVPEGVTTYQTIVPPSTILLAAPLALLPPAVAAQAGMCLNAAAILTSVVCLWRLLGLDIRSPAAIAILALAIALPGSHDTIFAGQTSGFVLLLFLLHLLLLQRGRTVSAGLLLGLALALKPHLLLGALVLHLLARSWRTLAVAALVVAALNAAMLLRLGANPLEPLQHWQEQLAEASQNGAVNDWANSGRPRYGFTNLQLPIYLATGSRNMANAVAILTAAGLLALAIWRNWRPRQVPSLGVWAVAIAVSLIPVYHRGYDAAMLLLPLAWAISQFTPRCWLLPALASLLPAMLCILRSLRFAPIDPANPFARILWGPVIAWSILLCAIGCLLLLHARPDSSAR